MSSIDTGITEVTGDNEATLTRMRALWVELGIGGQRTWDAALSEPGSFIHERAWAAVRANFQADQADEHHVQVRENRERLFTELMEQRDRYFVDVGDSDAATAEADGRVVQAEQEPGRQEIVTPPVEVVESEGIQELSEGVDTDLGELDPLGVSRQERRREDADRQSIRQRQRQRRDRTEARRRSRSNRAADKGLVTGAAREPFDSRIVLDQEAFPPLVLTRAAREAADPDLGPTRSVSGISRLLSDALQRQIEERLRDEGVTFRGRIPMGTLINLLLLSVLGIEGAGVTSLSEDDRAALSLLRDSDLAVWQEDLSSRLESMEEQLDRAHTVVMSVKSRAEVTSGELFAVKLLATSLLAERFKIGFPAGAGPGDIDVTDDQILELMDQTSEQATRELRVRREREGRAYHP